MELQVLSDQLNEFSFIDNWSKQITIIPVDNWQLVDPNKLIFCSGNLLHINVRHWLTHNYPVYYHARGYLGNHRYKSRSQWSCRISLRSWANTKMLSIPYSRWNTLGLPRHPWKVKAVKKVLIAPSKMTSKIWCGRDSQTWAENLSKQFPGAEVLIRLKGETPGLRWDTLWNDLDWADLVVSQSSAITCEAFWYGKKVISSEPCNTWAAERTLLENWKDPKEPELREQWHEHLAWSQFTRSELESGEIFNLTEKYYGSVIDYNQSYDYNLSQ